MASATSNPVKPDVQEIDNAKSDARRLLLEVERCQEATQRLKVHDLNLSNQIIAARTSGNSIQAGELQQQQKNATAELARLEDESVALRVRVEASLPAWDTLATDGLAWVHWAQALRAEMGRTALSKIGDHFSEIERYSLDLAHVVLDLKGASDAITARK